MSSSLGHYGAYGGVCLQIGNNTKYVYSPKLNPTPRSIQYTQWPVAIAHYYSITILLYHGWGFIDFVSELL